MEHSFNIEFAKEYGIEEAIIVHNIFYWIDKNVANEKYCYDGSYWTYNSVSAFNSIFPYMNSTKIYRVLNNLVEKDIIKKGNYNKEKFDNTCWYSFTDNGLSVLEKCGYRFSKMTKPFSQNDEAGLVKMTKRFSQNETTIPYSKQYIVNNNIVNNIKEDTKVSKKSAKFDFKAELIALGVEEDIARDWLLVRKAKKATNSETAFNILKKQFSISGISPNECIKICIDRNWMGFKAEWVSNLNKGNNQQNQTTKGNSNDKVKKLLNKNVHVIDSEGTLSDGTYLKNNYRYYFSKREGRAASIMLSAPPMPSDDMEFDSISGQWYIPREIRDNEKITDMLW